MTTLSRAFVEHKTNLIPFLVAGFPDVETTIDLITILSEEGVTAIELGVPFSDPVADGPVIQQAAEKALDNGITLHRVLTIAQKVRENGIKVPLVLFSYYNPLLAYGLECVAADAAKAGFSGFIVPDLPQEESSELRSVLSKVDVSLVPLVAPTSEERVAKIVQQAEGFIYCVSSLGPTGMRQQFANNLDVFLKQVRNNSSVPMAVGFGVSNAQQVQQLSEVADGVIVGSALVKRIIDLETAFFSPADRNDALYSIREFVRELLS